MVQEPQRKRKEPTLRRTKQGSLLWCLSLTQTNFKFLWEVPQSRFNRTQKPTSGENNFGCAMPNEAQITPKIAPRGSLTMRISPKAGQGKSPVPRASKKVFSYRRRETFRRPSTFRLPSAHPQQQQLHRKVVSHQNIFFFWLECRIVFGSPFGLPQLTQTKTKKKFFRAK